MITITTIKEDNEYKGIRVVVPNKDEENKPDIGPTKIYEFKSGVFQFDWHEMMITLFLVINPINVVESDTDEADIVGDIYDELPKYADQFEFLVCDFDNGNYTPKPIDNLDALIMETLHFLVLKGTCKNYIDVKKQVQPYADKYYNNK
jgi:hypothetical protein